jgi:hypothetical protein
MRLGRIEVGKIERGEKCPFVWWSYLHTGCGCRIWECLDHYFTWLSPQCAKRVDNYGEEEFTDEDNDAD